MSISEYLSLILNVLKDIRVILTAIVMILIIEFAKYITSYTKKAPKVKVKKEKKKAPAPAAEKPAEEAEDNPPDMSENDAG